MGTAALIVGGLQLAKGIGEYNQAKSSARATANQGRIAIENRKKEIQSLVAKQKIGYLQSGIELEGTAQAVIQDTYTTGQEDISAIGSAYSKSIKNQLTQARAQLLGSIANTAVSMYSLGAFSGLKAGNPAQGAIDSGGHFMGETASGVDMYNLTGTAKNGGNVNFTNASYKF